MGFTHFKHIKNENKDVEQYAEADLLAVMLFADVWFDVEQKGMPAGSGSLAPPLCA